MSPKGIHRASLYACLFSSGLLWAVPFLNPFHTAPIPSFYSEWLAFFLGFLAVCALIFAATSIGIVIPRITWHTFILVAYIATQTLLVTHTYLSPSFSWALYLGWAALLSIIGASLRAHLGIEKTIRTIAWCVLGGGVASVLLYWLLLLLQYPDFASGLIAQKNHFATYLTLAICGLIYLYAARRVHLTWTIAAGTLLVSGLTMTGSRSVFLYLGGLIALALYHSYRSPSSIRHRSHLLYSVLAVFAVFVATQFVFPEFYTPADTQAATAVQRISAGNNIELRINELRKAWIIFLANPILGVGVDQYAWQSYLQGSGKATATTFSHSHNLFLQLLAETGIIGLGIVLFILVTWLRQFLRSELTYEIWFGAGTVIVLFIHSNLEHPLWFAYFLGLIALVFGIFDKRCTNTKILSPTFSGVVASLALLVVLVFSANTLNAYSQMQDLAFNDKYKRDEGLYPLHRALLEQIGKNRLFTPHAEFMLGTLISLNAEKISDKLAISRRTTEWRPVAQNVYRHSILLALDGQMNSSIKQLRLAASTFPNDLDETILLIELKKNDPAFAYWLREAVRIRDL